MWVRLKGEGTLTLTENEPYAERVLAEYAFRIPRAPNIRYLKGHFCPPEITPAL